MPNNIGSSSMRPRSSRPSKVCCAVVGAGPFADAYAPLLQMFEREVYVRYVWSRSAENSKSIIATMEPVMQKARAMCGEVGFSAILADPKVEAVVLVLPPSVALEYVIRVLSAGKCVLSEKPLASTIADARACIRAHRKLQHNFKVPPVWFVAENFRFEEAFVEAARIMPRLGFLLKLDLVADTPLNARYYVSSWCRNQAPGGFLIDMSVHHMAALRLVAEAANAGHALTVKASTRDSGTGLAAPDCADATVTWSSGLVSCLSICMVASQLQYRLSATGVRGSLEITRVDWDQYKLKYKLKGDKRSTSKSFRVAGVQNEFRAFLNLVGDWRAGIIPQLPRKENQMQNPPSPLTPSPSKVRSRFSSEAPVGPDKVSVSEDGALREGQEPLPELRGRPEEGFWDLALAAAIIESGDSGATTKVPDL